MTHPPGAPEPHEQQPEPSPAPPPPGAPGYGPPGYGQPAYGPPGWYGGPPPYRLPDHPEATKALVIGIIALLGGFTCYVPLLLGPWAWVVGRRVVRQVDADPGRWDGRGQAMAGYVMGVVATVLLVLGLVAVVGLMTFASGMMVWGSPAPFEGQSL